MSTVVVNGSDPEVYLPNGARIALGLIGESTRPESIVQAAQDGYFTATGQWIYVAGMSNTPGTPPAPAPTIGTVKIDGNTNIELGVASYLSCVCSGNATDLVYRWSTGCGAIAIVGPKTAMTVQVSGISATSGNCWLLCTVTSPTASDGSGDAQAAITVSPPAAAKTTAKAAKK